MAVFDETTGKMMEMRDLVKHPDPEIRKQWNHSVANEFGRLMKGIGRKKNNGISRVGDGHDTFRFIKKEEVPKGRKVTYARFCCDQRPQKEEVNRTRLTVGGDRLEYEGQTSTEVASLETTKILINSTISTEGARFACADIGNMYTNSRLDTPEYMRIHINDIPEEVQEEYNTDEYVKEDGYVYYEIN